ncbi:MAG: M48 family metalloprotease [Myxococcales bacterium]|nr:M48 family metalloprotease [Myxococcales bacterium]
MWAPRPSFLAVLAIVAAGVSDLAAQAELSGRELFEEYKQTVRVVSNEAWNSTVDQVVAKLAAVSEPVNEQYDVAVLDAPDSFNAFALSGGYIAIYSGVFELFEAWLKDQGLSSGSTEYRTSLESLLAGVLSHEMAHVLLAGCGKNSHNYGCREWA